MHFANSARTARPTPNRIVGKPPTTSGPTAEEECPEISIQFSCKKLFIPTVAERRRRRHPPGRKLGESRRLAPKTPHGQARAAFSTAQPPPVLLPAFSQGGSCGALRATIKRMSPFIVCAARNHDHLVAFRFGRPAIFRRDGGCLPGQVKTHPLFRIGCAERGAILPVRVPEVVKTIYFLKKRARLFFNSQNYSIFALDFAE